MRAIRRIDKIVGSIRRQIDTLNEAAEECGLELARLSAQRLTVGTAQAVAVRASDGLRRVLEGDD